MSDAGLTAALAKSIDEILPGLDQKV